MKKAVENIGQPCLFLRAKFEAHVRPDLCRGFGARRRTPMWQAACVNEWHEASPRKLAEVLHRSSQGQWIHHISISVCIYYRATRRIMVFVHGDDFVSTGSGAVLRWLEAAFE